ncbi:unnamed protein product [Caenorhabditis angaria]|uniref:C2 domain-containing protein n=1 Tax=Caenorhabditis angaria TaxID=860376 RepID=A0A9P1J426_9PELO|nr:unnamed protein product [Caenorhabditis angaria]
MLNDLVKESAKVGLKINESKTKSMRNRFATSSPITIANTPIGNVEEYVYLGRQLNPPNEILPEIHRRRRAGWAAFKSIEQATDSMTCQKTKAKLFDQTVLPALCYGAETWTLTKKNSEALRVSHAVLERRLVGIKLSEQRERGIHQEDIRRLSQVKDPLKHIRQQKLRWAGHIARRTDSRWTTTTLEWCPKDWKRPVGRPPMRWSDELRKNYCIYDNNNKMVKHWTTRAKDRDLWRAVIISGQHVYPNTHYASLYIEVEVIGIPNDCVREKSKVVQRNSVNPIWNHTTQLRIACVDLAFLRIAVCDSGQNGKVVAHRVVPVQCIRPGFRHLPLRTPTNLPIDNAMIFLRTRFEQEEHIYLHDDDSNAYCNLEHTLAYRTDMTPGLSPTPILKKQIFVLRITGAFADETAITVHSESGSTVKTVMQQALLNAGKNADQVEEYVLIEEAIPSQSGEDPIDQRVLPLNEPIMDAVACWNGSMRRFVLRKKGSDPSSRAWITSIIKSGTTSSTSVAPSPLTNIKSASSTQLHGRSLDSEAIGEHLEVTEGKWLNPRARSMGDTFLVCVHNVSEDQPYAILRASINSTASDIIRQVFVKARRPNIDETEYVLVEETSDDSKAPSTGPMSNKYNSNNTSTTQTTHFLNIFLSKIVPSALFKVIPH